jgi:ribosomal protein S6--L-glutamate ligase
LAAYKRVAKEGEIRANIHSGGTRERHQLTETERELAIRSAEIIGVDICGVDILNGNKPSVIEVNLSPSVWNLKDICDVNVPALIAQYLFKQKINSLNVKKKKKRKWLKK